MEQLSNISNIKNILGKHGFTFSKALGQNFLINPSVCPRMAAESGAEKNIGVIEIGPGIGVLTCELARLAHKVVAIELDKRLLPVLDETLKDFDNVKVINADVLKVDLQRLIAEEFSNMEVVVCANLPYYITSPVIMRLLEERLPISSLTVMVQKEAAQRICARAGSRQAGAVTIAVRYYCEPKLLFDVSAGSFMPAPKVDSAVIKLDIHQTPTLQVDNEKNFFKVVKAAFGQRRKTLPNALSAGLSVSKAVANAALEQADIPLNYRAEQLTMEQFASLANCFEL
ncbi:MAG TPA: 16S rRNA (adenine(1518)-N(6)/adenine(1519)-N(6))-dimethyltransferase RsmA [Clostridiales bacterium]|nr:16S rRNA (adenine(1518)-N(6)/adenine(1519)-N(6))-dimethyltransferase RsmA [Clostridiales bacterium]